MRAFFVSLLLSPLIACAPVSEDTPGTIYEVSGGRVTILAEKKHGHDAKPTTRMIEQAQEVCPSAAYQTALPSAADFNMYEYVFNC